MQAIKTSVGVCCRWVQQILPEEILAQSDLIAVATAAIAAAGAMYVSSFALKVTLATVSMLAIGYLIWQIFTDCRQPPPLPLQSQNDRPGPGHLQNEIFGSLHMASPFAKMLGYAGLKEGCKIVSLENCLSENVLNGLDMGDECPVVYGLDDLGNRFIVVKVYSPEGHRLYQLFWCDSEAGVIQTKPLSEVNLFSGDVFKSFEDLLFSRLSIEVNGITYKSNKL